MKDNFSITFWIKTSQNPGWMNLNSDINFPPFTLNNGFRVFFSKYGKKLKVYILNPEFGYRKIVTDVEDYLQKDAFIALTNCKEESNLYVNAELKSTVRIEDLGKNLEKNDYVMVKIQNGDLNKIKKKDSIKVILPAKIVEVKKDKIVLNFFEIGEISEVPTDRLVY